MLWSAPWPVATACKLTWLSGSVAKAYDIAQLMTTTLALVKDTKPFFTTLIVDVKALRSLLVFGDWYTSQSPC